MSATEHWKPGMGQIWDPGNHKRVGIGLLATDTVYSRDFPSLTPYLPGHRTSSCSRNCPNSAAQADALGAMKSCPAIGWRGWNGTTLYSISFLCEIFGFSVCQIRFLQSIPDTSQYRGEGAQGDSTGSPRFPEVPEFSAGSIHPQSPRRQRNMGDANWEAAQSRLGWESPGTMYPGWSEHAYPTQNWLRCHGPWPVALMLYNM